MDVSQITELANAIMDSWSSASPSDLLSSSQHHPLGFQPSAGDSLNKLLGGVIKQEPQDPNPMQMPQQVYAPGFGPVLSAPQTLPETLPMDDIDPLESFTFWDGENFYCQSGLCDMQTENTLPPLPEYVDDELMAREDELQLKDAELLNNPTLAELNSGGETLFDCVPGYLPEEIGYPGVDELAKTLSPLETQFVASPQWGFHSFKPSMLSSSCPVPTHMPQQQQPPFLEDSKFLLCPQNSPASLSTEPSKSQLTLAAPSAGIAVPSRVHEPAAISSSAPPDVTMTSRVPRVKVEPQAQHCSGHRVSAERSLSGFSTLSLSNDEESGSFFDDTDRDDDFSSEEDIYQYESDEQFSNSWASTKDDKSAVQHRKHRFFWQYNLQSRGTKTQNLLPRLDSRDPHVLNDAFDPVFSEECALPVKHSGKARRGDGNDLTPNPCKLYNIGVELKKLNKLIYNINPHDGSSQNKPLSRKEKNKLASRVCRLKKKAQHEANKLKLYGLQQEHKRLVVIINDTRELLRYKIENLNDAKVSNCSKKLENYLAANDPQKVAGNTAVFVNQVLEKVAKGECDGGLGQL